MLKPVKRFFELESAGGIVLFCAAVLALILSNSPAAGLYQWLLDIPFEVRLGALVLAKPLLIWVNDLWMAVFFFLVGLEIKRELIEGELSTRSQAVLPAVAALGGVIVPALIYVAINRGDAIALRGWAIPAATDIAFALGILLLLGSRVPVGLKVFLTAVAIIDDLGAIVIIALFYTENLSPLMLGLAVVGALVLLILNRVGVKRIAPYVLVGLVVWVRVLKSGVHATLAGVVAALAIPLSDDEGGSPLRTAEHALHPWVAYGVLPVFAFANAGVSLAGVSLDTFAQSVPLGIAAGLVFGKALGVFGASALVIRLGWAELPAGADWRRLFAVSVLCGIGFTMSLFIGSLAFSGQDPLYDTDVKLGVLAGSLVAGLAGYLLLRLQPMPQTRPAQ
jgi:NhaA family Na+:H+ antiporter